jgi:hypothetical protein
MMMIKKLTMILQILLSLHILMKVREICDYGLHLNINITQLHLKLQMITCSNPINGAE